MAKRLRRSAFMLAPIQDEWQRRHRMTLKLGSGRGWHKSGPRSPRGPALLFCFLRPFGARLFGARLLDARLWHEDVIGLDLVRRFLGETLLAQAACLRRIDFEPLLPVARDI